MKAIHVALLTVGIVQVICFDPYDVLGVGRRAGPDEIRKTYKKLAREFHPDKNRSPDAGDKFTEINKAYEILGDEKRKEQYDRFGRVVDSPQQHGGGHDFQGGQFFRTPFGDFQFPGGGFGGFDDKMGNTITSRYLQSHIIPESYTKPYFFFATTDFCFNCMRVQPIWKQFTKDLDILDLGFGVVDVDYEYNTVKRLKIPRIPSIGAVFNGKSVLFDAEEYSVKNLRDFMRRLLPGDLVQQVTSDSLDTFLSGYKDNRVRVMFYGSQGLPTMRFLLPIYQVRNHILATYVDVNSHHQTALLDRFDVGGNMETLLILKEDSDNPAYAETKKQFTSADILAVLKSYKYLQLPRINTPEIFDDLCPRNTGKSNDKYCLILTFDSSKFYTDEVNLFRDYITQRNIPSHIKMISAFSDTQKSLIEAWGRPKSEYQIALVARRTGHEADIHWIEWCTDKCAHILDTAIKRLSTNSYDFSRRNFKRYEIKDEFAGGLLSRILQRLKDWWDYFTYTYFDGDSTLTLVSILSTSVCFLILAFILSLIGTQSAERRAEQSQAANNPAAARSTANNQYRYSTDSDKFVIYDLRNHNYDKLVREALQGYRLILLFVTEESKQRLVRRFAELMMPFNRTPYFLFGFVYIDKYLSWYQRMLNQTVGGRGDFRNISPDQCAGTVLAVNGYRKYYNIYHPKTVNLSQKMRGEQDGAFIGLDDSSSESEHEDMNGHALNGHSSNGHSQPLDGNAMLAQGRLLDGLGHWVDRLFDGSLPKCKIDYWPQFPVDNEPEAAGVEEKPEEKKDQ